MIQSFSRFLGNKYNIEIISESSVPSGWDTDRNGKRWEDYETIVCPNGEVIDMAKLLDDQQRAKAALIHLAPFMGGFVNNLHYVYTFRVKTQATDGYHIFVNPQFTYKMDLTEKCFVMAHEIMHCLLNHMRRGRGHEPQRSNIAADYECNISLVEMGLFKLPTLKNLGAYVDTKYTSWGYEKIYDDIGSQNTGNQNNSQQSKQAQQNSDKSQDSSKSGQPGQSSQSSSGSGNGSGSNNNSQKYSADYIKGWNKAMADYKKGNVTV